MGIILPCSVTPRPQPQLARPTALLLWGTEHQRLLVNGPQASRRRVHLFITGVLGAPAWCWAPSTLRTRRTGSRLTPLLPDGDDRPPPSPPPKAASLRPVKVSSPLLAGGSGGKRPGPRPRSGWRGRPAPPCRLGPSPFSLAPPRPCLSPSGPLPTPPLHRPTPRRRPLGRLICDLYTLFFRGCLFLD